MAPILDKATEKGLFSLNTKHLLFSLTQNFVNAGPRQKINAPDCAVFWFVCKAHPPVHIGGYVVAGATQQTDQRTSQMVYLFFAEVLRPALANGEKNEEFKNPFD